MPLDSKHPKYNSFLEDWSLCRDSYEGEKCIKDKGETYLPATSGQKADGMLSTTDIGYQSYSDYRTRAVYHSFLADAVRTSIGLMWCKPPTIELPAQMRGMINNCTPTGESIQGLLRRINEQQLVTGRIGLLLDLPSGEVSSDRLPYIASYSAESIINWDESNDNTDLNSLNLVVLDESGYERRTSFDWEYKKKYRVLSLGDLQENEQFGTYRTALFGDGDTFSEGSLIAPSIRGKTLNSIPFVIINSKDVVSEPDRPPLVDLARLGLAVYRMEADYRQSLFLQGQDTLVVMGRVGDEQDSRVGAGTILNLPMGANAKYVGVDSTGLTELRKALENDRAEAGFKSGEVVDSGSRQVESGDTLETRLAAQTATLNHIALSASAGLEKILKSAAIWLGLNPDEVIIKPNLDFVKKTMKGKEIIDLTSAKNLGAPISKKTIHANLRDKGITQKTYDEEIAEIEEEPIEEGNEDL